MTGVCANGCGQLAVHKHHICFQQHVRKALPPEARAAAVADPRNLLPLCWECHAATHNRTRPLHFEIFPDELFDFVREVFGAGPGYELLIRHYVGEDERVAALLAEWVAAA